MHPKFCVGNDYNKRDTFEELKEEYDDIKKDMRTIETMNISKEAKALPLKELQEQIDDIKERMHDVIDKY